LEIKKALYGLKQAGRIWNEKLNDNLIKIGFIRLKSEPCIYLKLNIFNKIISIIAVYLCDILLAGNKKEIEKINLQIKNECDMTDIGNVDFIIGIKFINCHDGIILLQLLYLEKILNKFEISKFYGCNNMKFEENKKLKNKLFDAKKYMQAVGSLLYLAMGTRPDILFVVSKASRKNKNPIYEDWNNVIKIFKYLKKNKNYGLKFKRNINIKTYVDADLGGYIETRRPTSFIIIMGGTPITWYSKLQHYMAVSIAERIL